jgi:hypothetical protein
MLMLHHRYRLSDSSPAIVALAKKAFAASRNQASWRLSLSLSLSLSLPWSFEDFGAPTFQYEDWLSRCRQIWPRTTLQQRSLTCGVPDNYITTSLLHIFARWDLNRLRPDRPASQPIRTPLSLSSSSSSRQWLLAKGTRSRRLAESSNTLISEPNDHLYANWFTRMKP